MRTASLALAFLLELICFGSLGYTGAAIGLGPWGVVLAVLFPLAAIVVWGRWNAPRSTHRLPTAPRTACELGVYAVTAVLLVVAGARVWAAVFAVLVVVTTWLTAGTRQRDV